MIAALRRTRRRLRRAAYAWVFLAINGVISADVRTRCAKVAVSTMPIELL